MSQPPSYAITGVDDGDDRGPQIIAVGWASIFVILAVLTLRICSKRVTKSFGADDWYIIGGTILFVLHAGCVTAAALFGGFRDLATLSPPQVRNVLIAIYTVLPLASIAFFVLKWGLAVYVLKLQGPTARRRPLFLHASFGVFLLITAAAMAVHFAQCEPVAAAWDLQLQTTGARCLPRRAIQIMYILYGAASACIDLLLVVYPVTIFWGLSLSLRKRVGLCALFGVGVIAATFCCLRTVYLAYNYQGGSPTAWARFQTTIFSFLESTFLMIGGCLPTLRPLWRRYLSKEGRSDEEEKGVRDSGGSVGSRETADSLRSEFAW